MWVLGLVMDLQMEDGVLLRHGDLRQPMALQVEDGVLRRRELRSQPKAATRDLQVKYWSLRMVQDWNFTLLRLVPVLARLVMPLMQIIFLLM